MIKIQSYGPVPSWYQIDNSFQLPSITGAVQWNGATKNFEVSNGGGWIRIDNNVQVQHSADLQKIIAWANIKMAEEEKMQNLRSKYPALDEAYNHLELIKTLVTAEPEKTV